MGASPGTDHDLSGLLALEHRALQRSAEGHDLKAVLDELLRGIEGLLPGALASVLVVDDTKSGLVSGAAPSLPAEFLAAIEPVPIGEGKGSCGTAAARRELVTVADIITDPLWKGYETLAERHGLKACWSLPFFDARGELLGTFAVYYSAPRAPSPAELGLFRAAERSVALLVERSRLWSEVQISRASYEAIFRGTAEAVIVIDAEGRFVEANAAAAELTGYTVEELKRLRVGALAPSLEHLPTGWPNREAPAGWRGDATLKRKDGVHVPVETRLTRAELATGPLYISSMRDAVERRALDELRQDFINVIAHEMRNPVSGIGLAAQLMRRKAGKELEPALDRIVRQTRQLDRLVGDLLDAHQLDTGKLKLELADTDLVSIACTCIDELADAEQRAKLEAPPGLVGRWDADRICQVLRNLIANAFKYGNRSEVTLAIEAIEGAARVSVTDRGPGISPEALPFVFDRYYRAPGASRRMRGFGVGLYICKQLVEAHGGAIAVNSRPGEGATFSFTLPRAT